MFLVDPATFTSLSRDEKVFTPWSHDKNLLNMAQRCLQAGHEVLFADAMVDRTAQSPLRVHRVYPTIKRDRVLGEGYASTADFVFSAYPESLALRGSFPDSTLVGWFAACHFLEAPDQLTAPYWAALGLSLATMDIAVTQQWRMAELITLSGRILGRPDLRVEVAPQKWAAKPSLTKSKSAARKLLGVPEDATVILNAGGTWNWTDFLPFIRAFRDHTVRNPRSKLFLLVSGLTQGENHTHDAYISQVEAVLAESEEWTRSRVHVFRDWDEGGRQIPNMLAAADVGLNVNAKSLEAWQAYRIRAVDYLAAELPIVCSPGDYFGDELASECAIVSTGHEVSAYEATLRAVDALTDANWKDLRAAASKVSKGIDDRDVYGDLLERLVELREADLGLLSQ